MIKGWITVGACFWIWQMSESSAEIQKIYHVIIIEDCYFTPVRRPIGLWLRLLLAIAWKSGMKLFDNIGKMILPKDFDVDFLMCSVECFVFHTNRKQQLEKVFFSCELSKFYFCVCHKKWSYVLNISNLNRPSQQLSNRHVQKAD